MLLNKIDRFIIGKFLSTFFFATILISVVAIIMHFAENIGRYIDNDIPIFEVITDYYIYFVPWINGLLWPLFVLISVMFFTSRMAKNTEIIPILGAGISFNRLLRPYLLAAMLLAGIHWVGYNYLIPVGNKYKHDFEAERLKKNKDKTRSTNVHFFIADSTKIFVRYYRKRDSTGQNFRLETFDDNGALTQYLKAKKISFKERPHTWTIDDYVVRKILDNKEELVLGKGEKLDTVINFTPEDFIEFAKEMENMPTTDLNRFIKKEEARGIGNLKKYYIEKSKRNAVPFSIIILTLIGAAVASRKVRGGLGLHMAIGVVIGASFELMSKFSTTFAAKLDLPVDICIWIPNIIFGLIAVILVLKAQK